MKNLLITLNSKYSHSSLSVRYLKSYTKDKAYEPIIHEFTINQHVDDIVRLIAIEKADVISFSCYIWNIEMTLKIAEDLKRIHPKTVIVFGGPEVSYHPVELLEKHPFVDVIIKGEGEITYDALMHALYHKTSLDIDGLVYRQDEIVEMPDRPFIRDLDSVPFPYDSLDGLENKKLYYESSRGCPFNCQYCLSSTTGHVRNFSLERVKTDLMFFIKRDVEQVKFVDRTFNANPDRALEIMKFIHENDNGQTNFHFEIVASLLNDETLNFLEGVRVGLFQFEIGVQTTNDETMVAIDRKINFLNLSSAVKKVSSFKNIHLHLDLIAGLPYENFERFKQSFDEVYALEPEKLQLGFLKLLHGSGLRVNEDKYGYVYSRFAPYEIFYNKYISYDELTQLKYMEEIVESYYNSKRFNNGLELIIQKHYNRAVDFYLDFANYWVEKDLFSQPHKLSRMYQILLDFYAERTYSDYNGIKEVLKYDYYLSQQKSNEVFPLNQDKTFTNRCYDFLKSEEAFDLEGQTVKHWLKRLRFVEFDIDIEAYLNKKEIVASKKIILFDYTKHNNVFNEAKTLNVTEYLLEE